MTTSIWRFPIDIDDLQTISVPSTHEVLSCAPARDLTYHRVLGRDVQAIDLWVRVAKSDHNVDVGIHIFGTGHPMPDFSDPWTFVGTCVMDNKLVWHVFTGPVAERLE